MYILYNFCYILLFSKIFFAYFLFLILLTTILACGLLGGIKESVPLISAYLLGCSLLNGLLFLKIIFFSHLKSLCVETLCAEIRNHNNSSNEWSLMACFTLFVCGLIWTSIVVWFLLDLKFLRKVRLMTSKEIQEIVC